MRTKNMAYIALMAVAVTLCSWISVPMVVPFTMQTFGIFCTLLLLGGRRGVITIVLYIFMGMVGLPVFSGFKSGISVIAGPTGGYIIGFAVCGLFYWMCETRLNSWVLLAVGNIICYIFGTVWFVLIYANNGKPITFGTALLTCVVPYILPDAVKLALAQLVASRLKPHINV